VKLAEIWAEVLGLERVGAHDNFFAVGGDSLSATRVLSRVRSAFHAEVSLRGFFARPTIADFAALIAQDQTKEAEPEELAHLVAELET
jgi:aryl carrier-like protein